MSVRRVEKAFRAASIEMVRDLALSAGPPETAADANEWYWILRFGHPLADAVQLRALFSGEFWSPSDLSKEEIAQLNAEDLGVLARSRSAKARMVAASDARTTPDDLVRLSGDPESTVRKAAGHNPETPGVAIAEMQKLFLQRTNYRGDKSPDISEARLDRLWLEVDSHSYPVDDEAALDIVRGYYDHHKKDRLNLARRQRVTPGLRARLAAAYDLEESVALELYEDEALVVRAALAGSLRAEWDVSIAYRLASDKAAEVRIALAGNSRTPEPVLVSLAHDLDIDVRCAAARNDSLPHDELRQLLQDQSQVVRRAAVVSGDFSFDELLDFDSSDDHREFLHARLARSAGPDGDAPTWGDEFVYGLRDYTNKADRDRWTAQANDSNDFLRRLAASEHASTRAAVARVTGAPEDILLLLAEDPEDSVRNAVCASLGKHNEFFEDRLIWWYVRENLDAAALSQSTNARVRALVAERLDADAVRPLATDPDPVVRAAVAANPKVPYDCLVSLVDDTDTQVRRAAEQHVAEGLAAYARDEDAYELPKWLEGRLDLPPRLKELRANHWNHRYRNAYVGRGIGTWTHWNHRGDLADMARASNPAVRLAVASYEGRSDDAWASWVPLGPDDLVRLMQDPDDKVRAAAVANVSRSAVSVAGDSASPASVLADLSGSRSKVVRRAVAGNLSAPGPALAKLVRDYETEVRTAVAGNANTPTEGLESLTLDEEEDVLAALCGNPSAPVAFMETQAATPPSSWSERWVRLAGNSSIPVSIARKLAYSRDATVRLGLASNPSTPFDVLDVLALDESPQIRTAVATRDTRQP